MSFEKTMKVFSPDGRIYQMEYAFKAISQFGQTSIAVRGNDSVVVCTQKKIPDKLIVPDSVTNIFNVSDSRGVVLVGNMNDARYIVQWLRNNAAKFKFTNGYEIPVHVLAQKLGHHLQHFSQQAGLRPFCVNTTIVGMDEEFGAQCYRVDPSGQAIGFKCVSTGSKEQEAMTQLEKHYRKKEGNWDRKETIETAIQVLQTVISSDFKANEIEIGVASVGDVRFKKLTEQEIENHLNDLADKQ
ncbi:proteasome subunit alpha type-6 [Stylonychia lemnae]|uniref:Proteasome subunit alpha type-6 n=1 Tax=Stylonychia lemnae TaxID=5949 RepID=A0A078AY92_STYLE|nr:proteasome subunit alpha type-6 [Stylonychia lemnae]|eukprot:CDW87101.1 proteasome subunit alpha type-6 [Stylonychia lemnae]